MKWMLERSILAGIWKNPRTWWWADGILLQQPVRVPIHWQQRKEVDGTQAHSQEKLWRSVDQGYLREGICNIKNEELTWHGNATQTNESYPKTSSTQNWIRWHSLVSNLQYHKVASAYLLPQQLLRSLLHCSQWIVLFRYLLLWSLHLFLFQVVQSHPVTLNLFCLSSFINHWFEEGRGVYGVSNRYAHYSYRIAAAQWYLPSVITPLLRKG